MTAKDINDTLAAKGPKQQIWGFSGGLGPFCPFRIKGPRVWRSRVWGLLSGGLESGGLESGGLQGTDNRFRIRETT